MAQKEIEKAEETKKEEARIRHILNATDKGHTEHVIYDNGGKSNMSGIKHAMPLVEQGQTWYVKLPGQPVQLFTRLVVARTHYTVVLADPAEKIIESSYIRYVINDVDFIERLEEE